MICGHTSTTAQRHLPTPSRWLPPFLLLLVTLLLPATRSAHAQAAPTATSSLSFAVFAAYTRVSPDYASSGAGWMLGGEANRHMRRFDIALEARYGRFNREVEENYLAGDLKLAHAVGPGRRIVPYIDAGFGFGSFRFPSGGTDSSLIKTIGGGCDFKLAHSLAAKIDYQRQFWDFGGPGAVTLAPALASAGLSYRFTSVPFPRRPH